MMDTFDDKLDDAARALGASLPALDDSLDDAIMARIKQQPHRRTAARPHSGIRWIFEPKPVRVRPVWVGLAAAAVIALLLIPRGQRAPVTTQAVAASDTVYVHFALSAPAATNVSLAGSFNNWEAAGLSLHRAADGSWEATIALPVGELPHVLRLSLTSTKVVRSAAGRKRNAIARYVCPPSAMSWPSGSAALLRTRGLRERAYSSALEIPSPSSSPLAVSASL